MKYLPQEIESKYLIPSVRKEIVLFLKEKGWNNKKIAKALNITEAAVSQYLHNKRVNWKIPEKFRILIREKLDINNINPESLYYLIEDLKKCGLLCLLHEMYDDIEIGCDICRR